MTPAPPQNAPRIGRIYSQRIHGEPKWVWCLQTDPAPPPNTGIADGLDDAKAAFAKRYEEVKRSAAGQRAVGKS
jgi:hypothetical protein